MNKDDLEYIIGEKNAQLIIVTLFAMILLGAVCYLGNESIDLTRDIDCVKQGWEGYIEIDDKDTCYFTDQNEELVFSEVVYKDFDKHIPNRKDISPDSPSSPKPIRTIRP